MIDYDGVVLTRLNIVIGASPDSFVQYYQVEAKKHLKIILKYYQVEQIKTRIYKRN